MAAVLVIPAAACGKEAKTKAPIQVTATPTPSPTEAPATATPTNTPKPTPVAVDPSVDFEDGKMDFVAVYKNFATADASGLEIADFNGSKALKVTKASENLTPLIAFDVYSLLGEKAADVASIKLQLGTSYADGTFNAVSGRVLFWTDSNVSKMAGANWAVYIANKNPYNQTVNIPEGVTLGADAPVMLVYFKEDNGFSDGHGSATLYIDNIAFLDKNGKTIKPASTEVAFNAPEGFENKKADRSNLLTLGDTVEIAGFNPKAGAWSQAGADMPQEFIDALVPGSTIEISYASDDGKIWFVFPSAAAGWSRVGDSNWAGNAHDEVFRNNSYNTAQIDYDQIVAICGEDKSTWGTTIQCEGSSAWEVYSIKVGKETEEIEYVKSVDFAGFATKAGAWSQAGFDMPQEIIDAIEPGTVIELNYTSDDGNLWIVLPNAAAGWSRVGDGTKAGNQHESATLVNGNKCYVTYEQIVALCGEDKAAWGPQLQAEASSAWEVYSVSVGKFVPVAQKEFKASVDFPGFATKGGAWSQAGFDFPQEVLDALVPGTAIELNYASDDGNLWIVLPNATAGWSRVGDGTKAGNQHESALLVDENKCYVTYEQIVALCGEDKAAWGPQLQAEASSAWEVYSVKIGQLVDAPKAPRLHNYTAFEGFATKAGAWSQAGFDMPQAIIDALVPGSVIELDYASEDGNLWVVFPNAAAGWSRVGDGAKAGNQHESAILVDGNKCYVTYEQIVALCGEDKSTWGPQLQAEASSAWEVYAVRIGQR